MSGSGKEYVIDPVKTESGAYYSSSPPASWEELPGYLKPSTERERKAQKRPQARTNERQSGVPLILSYLAGPLSILATRRGRRKRFWAGLSVFSVILAVVVVWMWKGISYWSTRENPVGAVMLLAAIVAVIAGFSAWTRAVTLAGRFEGPRMRRSPEWMRGRWAAGILGFICPGMGLFVAGRYRHAAAALWMACLTTVSILVLSRALWLWNFNAHAGAFALRPDMFEYILIVLGAAAVLGGLAWIVQALNGARLAGRASNRKAVSRRNWAAAALMIAVVAFPFLSSPEIVAEALDGGAAIAGAEGMRIIPLHLSRAAVRIDPSRPGYVIRAIGLYEDVGDLYSADAMRSELVARLEPAVPLLEEAGMVIPAAVLPPGEVIPAAPAMEPVKEPVTGTVPAELMILDRETGPMIN
jgi:hypothetical protein